MIKSNLEKFINEQNGLKRELRDLNLVMSRCDSEDEEYELVYSILLTERSTLKEQIAELEVKIKTTADYLLIPYKKPNNLFEEIENIPQAASSSSSSSSACSDFSLPPLPAFFLLPEALPFSRLHCS